MVTEKRKRRLTVAVEHHERLGMQFAIYLVYCKVRPAFI